MNLPESIRNRLVDIIVIALALLFFFMLGESPEESSIVSDSKLSETTASTAPPVNSIDFDTTPSEVPEAASKILPKESKKATKPKEVPTNEKKPLPPPPPYNKPTLAESFKQLKGGTASEQALKARNHYFQKLSHQLKELQGQPSAELDELDQVRQAEDGDVPTLPIPENLTGYDDERDLEALEQQAIEEEEEEALLQEELNNELE